MTKRHRDGTKHGDPIPGSRFYRAFCARCGEPMRVQEANLNRENMCSDCDPPHMGVGNPRASLNGLDQDPDAYARARPD